MLLGYLTYSDKIDPKEKRLFDQTLLETSFPEGILESYEYDRLIISIARHTAFHQSPAHIYNYTDANIVIILVGSIFHYQNSEVKPTDLDELLLCEYSALGVDFLSDVNGEFSICIFDFAQDKYLFGKDHIGTVPMTIIKDENGVFFGTDMNGMAKSIFKDEKIEDDYIYSRFYGYGENYRCTPFSGIQKVLPAHFIEISDKRMVQSSYWSTKSIQINESIDFETAVNTLEKLTKDAVKVRIKDGYTVGSHYSGGIDSSIVAGMTREACGNQEEFYGFSWSPEDYIFKGNSKLDERILIREQAAKSSILPVFINTNIEDFIAFLSDWRAQPDFHYETPTQKEAQKKGINLLFSGWGGDEFIGIPKAATHMELFKKRKFRKFFKNSKKQSFKGKIVHLYNNVIFPFRRTPSFRLKSGKRVAKYLRLDNNLQENKREIFSSKNRYLQHLMSYRHNAQRCETWYTSGQRNGVEYTFPLLDKRIIEYCFSLNVELFAETNMNKPLLRAIGKEYLIDKIRLEKQLFDPVLIAHEKELDRQSLELLTLEFQDFKQNPYLSFVNFEKIEADINAIGSNDSSISNDIAHILSYLKSVHSYTLNVGNH